jgi:hypothetical protein
MADSAVRFFPVEHPQIVRTVRGKLEAARRDCVAQIADGYAADWSDYKYRAGVIAGIDIAIQACIDADAELNEQR